MCKEEQVRLGRRFKHESDMLRASKLQPKSKSYKFSFIASVLSSRKADRNQFRFQITETLKMTFGYVKELSCCSPKYFTPLNAFTLS